MELCSLVYYLYLSTNHAEIEELYLDIKIEDGG
jgi:hypothetical protein